MKLRKRLAVSFLTAALLCGVPACGAAAESTDSAEAPSETVQMTALSQESGDVTKGTESAAEITEKVIKVLTESKTETEAVTESKSESEPATSTEDTITPEEANTEATELKTTTYSVNGVEFTMVLVEAGTFTMGSDTTQSALAAHEVTLEQDYLMGETEVTQALWNAVMGSGGGSENLPQTSVTWDGTFTFLEKLNEIAHEQGVIAEDQNFHLPTEEQWEFAARGGNLSEGYTYAGSNNIDEVAETQENSGTSPVAVKQKAPNELGLYDMSGNAYEWVDATESGGHVKKGGSNYHSFTYESYLYTPEGRYIYNSTDWTIGFRICLY